MLPGGVERFEDLIAWQKARQLTKAVYQATQQGAFAKDFGLAGQIQRASVSIMSNIAEGFERGNSGDFHRFLVISKPRALRFALSSISRWISATLIHTNSISL